MTLHTYNPELMSLPSINILHLTVSEIQPGQAFSSLRPRRPSRHAMGENNTRTALKGCGVKTSTKPKLCKEYLSNDMYIYISHICCLHSFEKYSQKLGTRLHIHNADDLQQGTLDSFDQIQCLLTKMAFTKTRHSSHLPVTLPVHYSSPVEAATCSSEP